MLLVLDLHAADKNLVAHSIVFQICRFIRTDGQADRRTDKQKDIAINIIRINIRLGMLVKNIYSLWIQMEINAH